MPPLAALWEGQDAAAYREHVNVVLSVAVLRRDDELARCGFLAHVWRVGQDREQTHHLHGKQQHNALRIVHRGATTRVVTRCLGQSASWRPRRRLTL